jgi:uncharacterized CHY-type Zn-finger protein
MPYYLLVGGYSTDVNDIDACHQYIDTHLTQQVEVQEKPDPRLVMYGVCLKEYTKTRKEYQDARRESSQLEDQR